MQAGHAKREWPVWLVCGLLVAATLLGFALGEGLAPARIAASAGIVLAAIKIHLVFDHYMELRWHHRPLRQALAIWLALVTAILLVTYWA
jgi:hypothetical protein